MRPSRRGAAPFGHGPPDRLVQLAGEHPVPTTNQTRSRGLPRHNRLANLEAEYGPLGRALVLGADAG